MSASLRELQASVMASLLGRGDAALPLVRRHGLAPARRLAIYRHNMEASLAAALAAVYPTVEALVGAPFFRGAARAYMAAHPSRSGNLHDFGAALPAFLEGFEPVRALPYLPDTARLEWAWHAVFHSERAAGPGAAALLARIAALPAAARPALRLRRQPAAALVASPWPVLRLWEVHQALPAGDAPLPVDLHGGGDSVLLLQDGGDVALHRLAPAEHALVHALWDGASLGEAVAVALDVDPATDVAALLARHLGLGTWIGLAPPA